MDNTSPTQPSQPSLPSPQGTSAASSLSGQGYTAAANSTSWEDPSGVWQKFLSASGVPATKQDVQTFFQTLLKFFGTLIQQDQQAHERAVQRLKDVAEGNE